MRLPYPLLCAALGLVVGWFPLLLHGPMAAKFNLLDMRGSVAVAAFYTARLLIGFVVGISVWPKAWYIRGPLCGLVMMLPVGLIALATPGCGGTCMFWNETTGAVIGIIVAGGASWLTGRDHA